MNLINSVNKFQIIINKKWEMVKLISYILKLFINTNILLCNFPMFPLVIQFVVTQHFSRFLQHSQALRSEMNIKLFKHIIKKIL